MKVAGSQQAHRGGGGGEAGDRGGAALERNTTNLFSAVICGIQREQPLEPS